MDPDMFRPSRLRLVLVCLLLCGAGLQAPAWALPGPGQWTYKVTGQARGLPYTAQALLVWQPDGTRYQAAMEIKAFLVGSRRQTSEGVLLGQDLQPTLFTDQRKKSRRVQMDPVRQTIRFEEATTPVPLPAGTQDRLSLFFQLGQRLLQLGPSASGQRWTVPVAGTHDVETWTFAVQPGEKAGQWHVTRVARYPADQSLEIWYAPTAAGVPVRIRLQSPDGDLADQVLAPQ